VVARQEIDYLRPLVYSNQSVVVQVQVEAIGTRSFTLLQTIREPGADGRIYARVVAVMVGFDRDSGGSRPLGEDERAALTALLPSG